MSLAPISTIAASAPSPSVQSSRASSPADVSPETPPLTISTSKPLALQRRLEPDRKGRVGGKAIAGGQAVAERDDPQGPRDRSVAQGEKQRQRREKNLANREAEPIWCEAGRPAGAKERVVIAAFVESFCMSDPAIRLENVNLALGGGDARTEILKNIGLEIGRGETVALLGPSGSGKSTLLMTMAGLEAPDSGAVWVAGPPPRQDGRRRAGALSRRPYRRGLPGLSPDPDL